MATQLTLGSGFISNWSVQQVGSNSNAGGDAICIARVNEPNFRDADSLTSGLFCFGVIADHINGIQKVEASFSNGTRSSATSLTYNSRTECYEYQFSINPSSVSVAGMYEIRFEVFPLNDGITRVLSVFFYCDPTGNYNRTQYYVSKLTGNDSNDGLSTSSPWRTLLKAVDAVPGSDNGDTVNIMDGDSSTLTFDEGGAFRNNTRPVVFQPYLGVDPSSIEINATSSFALRLRRMIWKGLKIKLTQNSFDWHGNITAGSDNTDGKLLWFDNCECHRTDFPFSNFGPTDSCWTGWVATSSLTDYDYIWCTDVYLHDFPGNNSGPKYFRNCTIDRVSDDTFRNVKLVYNCTANDSPGIGEGHVDGVQWDNAGDINALVWNVKLTDIEGQLVFSDSSLSNISVVNVVGRQLTEGTTSNFGKSSASVTIDHVLVRFCSFTNQPFLFVWADVGFTDIFTNCLAEGVAAKSIFIPDDQGVTVRKVAGWNGIGRQTAGDPSWLSQVVSSSGTEANWWVDSANGNFAPGATLESGVSSPSISFDYNNDVRGNPTALGGIIGSSESTSPSKTAILMKYYADLL
jgi:hypothetical protein